MKYGNKHVLFYLHFELKKKYFHENVDLSVKQQLNRIYAGIKLYIWETH